MKTRNGCGIYLLLLTTGNAGELPRRQQLICTVYKEPCDRQKRQLTRHRKGALQNCKTYERRNGKFGDVQFVNTKGASLRGERMARMCKRSVPVKKKTPPVKRHTEGTSLEEASKLVSRTKINDVP